MSDTSSGWSTSEDDLSGNEYSVRTKQDKLDEIQQKKLHKKSRRKKKKHKRKNKKLKYKSDDSDSNDDTKKNNINSGENTSQGELNMDNVKDDVKNGSLRKGHTKSGCNSPSPRRRSPDPSRPWKISRSRSPSKDKRR